MARQDVSSNSATPSNSPTAAALVEVIDDVASLVPAVTRAAAILEALAEKPAVPLGPTDLTRRLGLPKSSIANICNALADAGLLRRVGTGFTLGRKLAELGGAYLGSVDLVQEFYQASSELPTAADETMQLAVLDGFEMIYLARHDGRQQIQLTSAVGRRLPATVTATGKAALAMLDDRELDRRLDAVSSLPAFTRNSITSVERFRTEIARIRQRGHAIDDEETVEGIVCLGVAIAARQPGEGPYAASVTLLKARAADDRLAALAYDLWTLGSRLSDPMRGARSSAASDAVRG